MKINNKMWLVVIAIVVIFLFTNYTSPQGIYIYKNPEVTLEQCESMVSQSSVCKSECKRLTQELYDCVTGCGVYVPSDTPMGGYSFFHDEKSCNEITVQQDICALGCYGGGGQFCNTEADTDCNGVVNKQELLNYGNRWLAKEITKLQFLIAGSAWLGGL